MRLISKINKKLEKLRYRRHKLKIKLLREYYKIEAKYRYTGLYLFSRFLTGIELVVAFLVLLSVLHLTSLINLTFLKSFFDTLPVLSNDINRQLVFSQVSITFIITSLFSLIISLKKEKVLGTSIYTITFAKSIFGNLILVSMAVFALLFLNIFFYIKEKSPEAILPLFLITLGIFSFLILKIILFTNSFKISREKIGSIYIWENRRVIRKGLKDNFLKKRKESEYLFNLSEDTHEKILRRDVEYVRNFYAFERVTNISLYNYKSEIQEYHLEGVRSPDTIEYWVGAIQALLRMELYTDALNQYTRLLNLFIRHEVYISSTELGDLLKQIFSAISATKSKVIFEQNKEKMLDAMTSTMQYSYYKINNDFSYTRLGKLNMAVPFAVSDSFFIDYYNIIDKKLDLNELEKSVELSAFFEKIRMISHDVTSLAHLTDVIKSNEMYHEALYSNGNLNLIGDPLSKLIILLIQERKTSRVLYFLRTFNNDSIYYACLIVATKLTKLYLHIEPNKRGVIIDSLMMILTKLIEWNDYQIKIHCYQLRQEAKSSYMEHAYGYSSQSLNSSDLEYLSIVRQTVMMRRKEVNIDSIDFSNEKLGEIAKLFSEVEKDLLNKARDQVAIEFEEKFGVLYLL
ncbi:hypothetical protein EVJ29_13180 [Exiguobacterium sp. SH4S7]|uniref:hypothetical protein n=1 Tax=Exiguobacterium sp. SH4S7 TaxID=2510958 RepID=UPI0010404452|nr:hypothetical protein [Exiguobacterium sp. SH4S7]TCI33836.1 hypothetical protein EVJ29_13180 [Exiguobacterium sp. SH4S7]